MAAAIALMLYRELPRAVFESERAKEDMLVERGEQYKMGIRRYYQKFRKMPQTLDELDNTNGQRFLRRRYKDPFTGKDEWKLIKVDGAGNLIDSVQSKKSATDKDGDKKGGTGSVSQGYSLGDVSNQPGQGEGANVAMQRRSSDRGIGADLAMQQYQQRGDAPDPQQAQGTVVTMPRPEGPASPGGVAGQPFPQGSPGLPQMMMPQMSPGGGQSYPQMPSSGSGFPQQGPLPLPPGLSLPGMVPQPGQSLSQSMSQQGLGGSGSGMAQVGLGGGQTGSPSGRPGTGVPFSPGSGIPQIGQPATSLSMGGSPGQNPAIASILGGLTNPARGMNVGTPGMFGAGGIAGVASKHKAEGIKLIDERSKINEWEFIYDPRKDKRITGATGGLANAPAGSAPTGSQMNNSSMSSGSSGSGSNSSFGSGKK